MAHSGFIANPEYTRRNQNEEISGKWVFKDSTTFDKVIQGTAIATYYADLAEYYEADISELIPVGSIVKFGGKKEITKVNTNDRHFFGIISSKPGFILNKSEKQNALPVGLVGRVPCRVTGKIKKFDKLTISKINGVARKKTLLDSLLFKPTVGIALESKSSKKEKLIEIFVHSHI